MRVSRKWAVLVTVAILLVLYGLWQGRLYLSGPRIELLYPKDGERILEERITVKGEATNINYLALNGRAIFTDGEGNFEEDFLLARGLNVLEIRAVDKFGRARVIRRMLYRP